jgi:hypothetical protein
LDRHGGVLAAVQDLGEVLPGMAGTGLEQGDGAVGRLGDHPGGKGPGALGLGPRRQGLGAGLGGEIEDAHGGVVVVEHRAVARLAGQLLKGRCQSGRGLRDDVPLGGGRQGYGERLLEPLDAVKRQPTAVLEQRDHGRGALIVFRRAYPRRGFGGEHRAAQPAAQALQLIDLCL